MKITIIDDGNDDVTVVRPKNRKPLPNEGHFCGECRHFQRHFKHIDYDLYRTTNEGHCYPPRDYSYYKHHLDSDSACCFFKPIENKAEKEIRNVNL